MFRNGGMIINNLVIKDIKIFGAEISADFRKECEDSSITVIILTDFSRWLCSERSISMVGWALTSNHFFNHGNNF